MGVDGVEDRFNAGEKSKSTTLPEEGCLDGGNDRGVNTQVGRELSPNSSPPPPQYSRGDIKERGQEQRYWGRQTGQVRRE